MKNGLYKVSFQTPIGQGFGVIVISDGTVKGGDSLMYYVGNYEETENQFKANIHVQKHSNAPGMSSVFGIDDVTVTLHGSTTDTSADITGYAAEAPGIQIKAQLSLLE